MITPDTTDSPQQAKLQANRRRGRPRVNMKERSFPINDRTEFLFPRNRQMFETVDSKYHLRTLLNEESRKDGVQIQMQCYSFSSNKRGYLYCKCNNCDTQKMRFLRIDAEAGMSMNAGINAKGIVAKGVSQFKLIYFDNTHNHQSRSQGKRHLYNMGEIFHIMQNTPKNMTISEFKQILKARFDINDSHVYYMLSRFRKHHESLATITEYLAKHGASMWTHIEHIGQNSINIGQTHIPHTDRGHMPQMNQSVVGDSPFFMFALPKMINYFKRYGDCCYFNIIKGLVKKKDEFGEREWEIIAFNGLTFHNRFAPFALAFLEVTPQSAENRVQLVRRVFNWGKTPSTFITPSRPVYAQLVDSLRQRGIFQGLHIYDALQQLEHIQKVISDNHSFKYFQEIVQSTNKGEYYQKVQAFHRNVVLTLQTRKMFNWLQEQAPRMCFALIETDRFIGMGFKYSANRYMSILVRYLYTHNSQSAKINLPRSKELYSSIKHLAKEYIKLLQPELSYIKYELWKMEQFMNMPEIMLVRNRVKQTVLEVFLSKFHKSMKVDARERSLEDRQGPERDNSEVKVYDIYDKNTRALYVVAPRAEYDEGSIFRKLMWRCNCLYSLKCGLPCEHELKVVMINNSSLLDQIDQRWIQPKIGRKKAPGRPKSSRRNMLK